MKLPKNTSPRTLNESEYEELIRLRAEIAYIKAENEVIKKRDRLERRKRSCATQGEKSSDYQNAPLARISTKTSFESYANVQIYLLF